jgi:hypothetical protein
MKLKISKNTTWFFLFNLFFFYSCFETITLIYLEESFLVLKNILVYLLVIYIFQIIIIYYLKFKFFFASFFSTINFISLKFVYISSATLGKSEYELIFFILLFLSIYIIYKKILFTTKILKIILISTFFLLTFAPLFIINFSDYSFLSGNKEKFFTWAIKNRGVKIKEDFEKIKFYEKPDIYIIGFDSAPNIDFLKKYLKINNLSYEDTIIKQGGKVFKNTFAMQIPTKEFFNNFTMFEQNNYKVDYERFSGKKNSLLFSVLKNNNYKIITGYAGNYFGNSKGNFIDEYITAGLNLQNSNVCLEEQRLFSYFIPRMLGLCFYDKFVYFFNKNKLKTNEHSILHGNQEIWPEKVVKKILELNADKKNQWFSLIHMYRPIGHTPGNYISNEENQKKFIEKQFLPQSINLNKIVIRLISELKNSKKPYIIIFLSDHGLWLSRNITNTKDKDKFAVRDKYGNFVSTLKTNHACSNNFYPYYTYKSNVNFDVHKNNEMIIKKKKAFTSAGRVLLGVMHCLSDLDSKNLIDNIVDFQNTMNFENYIYED